MATPLYKATAHTVRDFPSFYGGKQQAYEKASDEVIQKGIDFIRKADGNYQKVFFDLLAIFERTRADIAKTSKTERAEEFGRRRDTSGVSTCYYTYLDQQYLLYGDRLKKMLGKYLPDLMAGKKPIAGNADTCQIRFRTYDIPDPKKASDYFKPLKPVQETPDSKSTDEEVHAQSDNIAAFRSRLLKLKETHPDRYQYIDDYMTALTYKHEAGMQHDIFSIAPNLLRFVTAEVYWKRGDAWIPATSYTCLYDSTIPAADAVEALMENPVVKKVGKGTEYVIPKPCVLVKHMDREHIQGTLDEIAVIFERCVSRKNPDAATLKGDLAEMYHKFSFAMPEERGSGAIVEWLESTVAGFHGFRARMPDKTMGYFEAVSVPYTPKFPAKYAALQALPPIEK